MTARRLDLNTPPRSPLRSLCSALLCSASLRFTASRLNACERTSDASAALLELGHEDLDVTFRDLSPDTTRRDDIVLGMFFFLNHSMKCRRTARRPPAPFPQHLPYFRREILSSPFLSLFLSLPSSAALSLLLSSFFVRSANVSELGRGTPVPCLASAAWHRSRSRAESISQDLEIGSRRDARRRDDDVDVVPLVPQA